MSEQTIEERGDNRSLAVEYLRLLDMFAERACEDAADRAMCRRAREHLMSVLDTAFRWQDAALLAAAGEERAEAERDALLARIEGERATT